MAENQEKETVVSEEIEAEETVKEETEPAECAEENTEKEMIEKEQYDVLYDKYLRLMAEYDNYKKRTQKEKDEIYSIGVSDVVENLLPVADNLERALSALEESEKNNFSEGVEMVSKQFFEILSKIGVTEIEALGEQFDPNVHNAVMHIDDEAYDANVVVEQFMKGYKYKEKVIRHSMVKVAN